MNTRQTRQAIVNLDAAMSKDISDYIDYSLDFNCGINTTSGEQVLNNSAQRQVAIKEVKESIFDSIDEQWGTLEALSNGKY